jgi:iron(III) transport system permease protein
MGGQKSPMITSDVLEKPHAWRIMIVLAILAAAFAPALPLLLEALGGGPSQSALDASFWTASFRSLAVAIAVAGGALVFGIPAGVLAGLYEFPGRRLLLALLGLPLIMPSFLWAIGWSQFRIHAGLSSDGILSGFTGTVLAFLCPAVPIVVYMTLVAARRLSKSQIEAARLSGGEYLVIRCAIQALLPAAILAATLAGILTLADPGPGQILGYPGVAYEILLSFSASYDFTLAATQCAALTGLVLVVSIPVAVLVAPNVAAGLLGRDIALAPLAIDRNCGWAALLLLVFGVTFAVVLPLAGIVLPLFTAFPVERASQEITRTLLDTFIYALTAGVLATVLGTILAVATGREGTGRGSVVVALFVLLALPPSLSALGIIKMATLAPPWLDPLLRGRFTVGLASALKFLPVAAILAMRSYGHTSPSQCLAAAIHGISVWCYIGRILVPALLPAAGIACTVIALLATAEVGTALLLRPPGADSIPVQIFTVMANAPEALVAALCFIYVAGAAVVLLSGWYMTLELGSHGDRV